VTGTNRALKLSTEYQLTNGEAVGPSRIASSSLVNGKRGIRKIRRGISNMIMIGNPIAAIRHGLITSVSSKKNHLFLGGAGTIRTNQLFE